MESGSKYGTTSPRKDRPIIWSASASAIHSADRALARGSRTDHGFPTLTGRTRDQIPFSEVVMLSKIHTIFLLLVVAVAGTFVVAQQQPATSQPSSEEILRTFRTLYVYTKTPLAKTDQLRGALLGNPDFRQLGLSIFDGPGADAVINFDHQPGWFYYTYSLVHSNTGTVLLAGQVTAWDGKFASKQIAKELIAGIKK